MKIAVLIGVIVASTEAWTFPTCEHDNCYRAVLQSGLQHEIKSFCVEWLRRTDTAAIAIPTELKQLSKCDVEAARSVCSCMTHAPHGSTIPTTSVHSATSTIPNSHPSTTITTTRRLRFVTNGIKAVDEGRSSIQVSQIVPASRSRSWTTHLDQSTQITPIIRITRNVGNTPNTKASPTTHITQTSQNTQALQTIQTALTEARWSTSTIYTTQTNTIISCSAKVTNCPVGGSTILVTKTIPVSTTICPVTVTNQPLTSNDLTLLGSPCSAGCSARKTTRSSPATQTSQTSQTKQTSQTSQTSRTSQKTKRSQRSSTSASHTVADRHSFRRTDQNTKTWTTPFRSGQSSGPGSNIAVSIHTGTATSTSTSTGTLPHAPTVATGSNIVVTPPQTSEPPVVIAAAGQIIASLENLAVAAGFVILFL